MNNKMELSNAGRDALVKKGIEDGKKGKYSPPHNMGFRSMITTMFDSKEEIERCKLENDAYYEGYRIGKKI